MASRGGRRAGWRHDESELDAFRRDVARPVVHLPLYQWFDEILSAELNSRLVPRPPDRIKVFKNDRTRVSAAYDVSFDSSPSGSRTMSSPPEVEDP